MKKKHPSVLPPPHEPTDDEIRDYAYHLYQQGGCVPGHDLENWLEAKACLEANIPKQHARSRLHRHRHPESNEPAEAVIVTLETPLESVLDPMQSAFDTGIAVERVRITGQTDE